MDIVPGKTDGIETEVSLVVTPLKPKHRRKKEYTYPKDWEFLKDRSVVIVDPGLGGTGVAHWTSFARLDHDKFKGKLPHETRIIEVKENIDWIGKADMITDRFEKFLKECCPCFAVFENQSVWDSTAAGYAAGKKGDIVKLAQLNGMMMRAAQKRNMNVHLLEVGEWKGQLSKDAVKQRIRIYTGIKTDYPNHVSDAIGMGFYLQGVL